MNKQWICQNREKKRLNLLNYNISWNYLDKIKTNWISFFMEFGKFYCKYIKAYNLKVNEIQWNLNFSYIFTSSYQFKVNNHNAVQIEMVFSSKFYNIIMLWWRGIRIFLRSSFKMNTVFCKKISNQIQRWNNSVNFHSIWAWISDR